MPVRVIYPGTFDPMTDGHVDLVARAASLYDEVIVGIAASPSKKPWFSLDERVTLAQQALAHISGVTITGFSGLLIDLAKDVNANVLLRGLRAVSDFEYEFQLATMNKRLMPTLETIFLTPAQEHIFISSSLIREIALHEGDMSQFVAPSTADALKQRAQQIRKGTNTP